MIEDHVIRLAFLFDILDSGCWIWRGNSKPPQAQYPHFRYGRVGAEHKQYSAHVLFYLLHRGGISDGMTVDHFVCFNPLCVNPDHLALKTNVENSALHSPEWYRRQNERYRSMTPVTHCKRGHELNDANTLYYFVGEGRRASRQCKACNALRRKKNHRQQVAA